jgi:acyl carrier protein
MSNTEKLIQTFANTLLIDPARVTDDLQYNAIADWDSVGHMSLVAALEETFGILLDTDDIIELSSVAQARAILAKYDVSF